MTTSCEQVALPVEPSLVIRLRAAGCVYAEQEAQLLTAEAGDAAALEAMAVRRIAGEPLEQVLGWAAFCGLRVAVASGVFVPRRRTELLVAEAARRLDPGGLVVDLCCGTGAVGAALVARMAAPIDLYAVDLDPAALACARVNLPPGSHLLRGDLFAPLPRRLRGRVDVVTMNAPYVPTDQVPLMPPEARDHEPAYTLDGGPDGLDLHRRAVAAVLGWLRPSGYLVVETSRRQGSVVAATMSRHGLHPRIVTSERLDATVVCGTAPATDPATGPAGRS